MLVLEAVSKDYVLDGARRIEAVRDVSLQVECGEFVVITGRSGSGKTTLLHLASGLCRPTKGQVCVDGVNLWEASEKERSLLRSREIGFAFQFPSLLSSLTTFENVTLPTAFCLHKDRLQASRRARKLLELVGLADKLDALPRQLSAGQQQRVVIARSLINQPQFLFADEPTSNLDEETEQEIMSLFKSIHSSMQMTVLLVTHSSQLVSYGTRGLRMSAGTILPH